MTDATLNTTPTSDAFGTPHTPWAAGRLDGAAKKSRLLFGATYEDISFELDAFRDRERIFCIAAAGDSAIKIAAAGHRVVAVDINATQVEYAMSRLAGGPYRKGAAEHVMTIGRGLMRLGGWSQKRMKAFANCADVSEQVALWDELNAGRSGKVLRMLLAPAKLVRVFQPEFVTLVGDDFADRLVATIRASLTASPNRENHFARMLFLGMPPDHMQTDQSAIDIEFAHADAISFLHSCQPGSFDGAAVSNIGDGTSSDFHRSLHEALQHALTPGAPVIVRTMGNIESLSGRRLLGSLAPNPEGSVEPGRVAFARKLAAQDRSLIWTGLEIQRNTQNGEAS
jgi:S-adenosylmethionine:diacylglycerol 3-amino-3-carboxypropyl transferase